MDCQWQHSIPVLPTRFAPYWVLIPGLTAKQSEPQQELMTAAEVLTALRLGRVSGQTLAVGLAAPATSSQPQGYINPQCFRCCQLAMHGGRFVCVVYLLMFGLTVNHES